MTMTRCYQCGTEFNFFPCPTCERNRLLAESNRISEQQLRNSVIQNNVYSTAAPSFETLVAQARAAEAKETQWASSRAQAPSVLATYGKTTTNHIRCFECDYVGPMGAVSNSHTGMFWVAWTAVLVGFWTAFQTSVGYYFVLPCSIIGAVYMLALGHEFRETVCNCPSCRQNVTLR